MAKAAGTAQARVASRLGSATVIWSSRPEPVPPLTGGDADAIASPAETVRTPDLHCVFAKEFTLHGAPSRALLHLFAFTRYRLYVNGVYVGRGPCRYQNQRPEYDTRDVRALLRAGRNVLAVLVHRDAPTGRIMQHAPGFVASLEVVDEGRARVISSDTTWLAKPDASFGRRAQAWASIEEHIDARKAGNWTMPDLTQQEWQPSVPAAGMEGVHFYPRGEPLQLEKLRAWSDGAPTLPVHLAAGTPVSFELPEIAQAYHLLEIEAEEGSELEVHYRLPGGEQSGASTYTARAGRQTYMGGDTFAFRKLELRLKSGSVRVVDAKAYEVRYPFERSGAFACSDPTLNQLWAICARSLELLSEDSYVDCADRERVEWTDNSPPAFDCTRVMMRGPDEEGRAHWGDARLLRGLLRRIALTQQPDGQLKAHSCSERFDIHAIMEDRSCDWVVLLREHLDATGDRELVRELWPTLRRLLAWYRQRRTERGLTQAREWEVWDNPLRYQVCEGAGLNAMLYRALSDAAAMARAIGRQGDAAAFTTEAARLRADYNRVLWNAKEGAYDGALFGPHSEIRPQMNQKFTGTIVDGRFAPTAQANVFALYSGIVPPERVHAVRSWLLAHLDKVRSPMSHYYLFLALYAMENEAQDRDVLSRMRTGWQNQIESEWQTTWEELEKGGGSKAHIYCAHPGYFLSAYVLGARRVGPVADRAILVEPRVSGLQWARGIGVTEFGPVEMHWKHNDTGELEITCRIPERVAAKVRLRSKQEQAIVSIGNKRKTVRSVSGWIEFPIGAGEQTIRIEGAGIS